MARLQNYGSFGTILCLVLVLFVFQPIKCESFPDIKDDTAAIDNDQLVESITAQSTAEEDEVQLLGINDCDPSPPDALIQPCVECRGLSNYLHTDSRGYSCKCEICRPPHYMEKMCECTAGGSVLSPEICSPPINGVEFMNASNWCSRPFKCSICQGDLEIKRACTAYTDTRCGCPVDTDRTDDDDPTRCEPIPKCPENYEIQRVIIPGSNIPQNICVMCDPGYTQPYNNSRQPCRLIETVDTTITPVQTDVTPKEKGEPINCDPCEVCNECSCEVCNECSCEVCKECSCEVCKECPPGSTEETTHAKVTDDTDHKGYTSGPDDDGYTTKYRGPWWACLLGFISGCCFCAVLYIICSYCKAKSPYTKVQDTQKEMTPAEHLREDLKTAEVPS